MDQPSYVFYHVPDTLTTFIGNEKSQIVNTLEHYKARGREKIAIPEIEKIRRLDSAEIGCALPILKPEHFFKVKLDEVISFDINANAFNYIQLVANRYEELKRGDLFKFDTGLPNVFGLFFLPENVMKGLKNYDWKQYEKQVDEWMGIRNKMLDGCDRVVSFNR